MASFWQQKDALPPLQRCHAMSECLGQEPMRCAALCDAQQGWKAELTSSIRRTACRGPRLGSAGIRCARLPTLQLNHAISQSSRHQSGRHQSGRCAPSLQCSALPNANITSDEHDQTPSEHSLKCRPCRNGLVSCAVLPTCKDID
jgi:hypothetical protein